MNLCVGILIVARSPLTRDGSLAAIGASLPSLIIGGVAFRFSPPLDAWPVVAEAFFVLGTLLALWAFFWLGRSFAILPAVRNVVVRGPYRIVRHPAYLGEMCLVAACGIATVKWFSLLLCLLALVAIAARIQAEESLLSTSPRYREYRETVAWKLFPRIW